MRRLLLGACTLIAFPLFGQVSTVGMKNEFTQLSKLGRLQGAEGLQTYSTGNIKGSRYFLPDWTMGELISSSDQVLSDPYLFLYDKQNQNLYFKSKDSSLIYLVDKSQVEIFQIANHQFIPGTKINGADENSFYELIAGNKTGYALYKLTKTKFVKSNNTDLEKIKMGDFEDEYKDEISFYLASKDQPLKKITFSEKKFLQYMPGQTQKIIDYFREHSGEKVDKQFASRLIDYLNH